MNDPTSARGFYGYCMAMLRRGFDNEHALESWLKLRRRRIANLPLPLKHDVEAAIVNCGPKEISK